MTDKLVEAVRGTILKMILHGDDDHQVWLYAKSDEVARAIIPLVQQAEREACAALVEQWNGSTRDGDTFHIAAAIRERGEHTQESQP